MDFSRITDPIRQRLIYFLSFQFVETVIGDVKELL